VRTLNLWPQKDRFLVINISKDGTPGVLFDLDSKKNLGLKKFWKQFSWPMISRVLGKNSGRKKIIASVDFSLARTLLFPIGLIRDETVINDPISRTELENSIAQEMARVFNQYRRQASRELGEDELHTILVDSKVGNFSIDGHRVINPEGFRAKNIGAVLELTYTTREVFDQWKNFFSAGENIEFFFTESDRSKLISLKKISSLPLNIISFRRNKSHCFSFKSLDGREEIVKNKIKWSPYQFIKIIESNLVVGEENASEIYWRYLSGRLSKNMEKFLGKLFKPSALAVSLEIKNLKLVGSTFIDSSLPVFPKFAYYFKKIKPITGLSLASELGFRVNFRDSTYPQEEFFGHLAPFIEFYYNREELPINRWLRRRIHWLGSS